MNSFLQPLLLLNFLIVFGYANAQEIAFDDSIGEQHNELLSSFEYTTNKKTAFSYMHKVHLEKEYHLGHTHEKDTVHMDLISSEKSADFNCSGGFCMNRSHYHRKGLTRKRQLFVYFMNITC